MAKFGRFFASGVLWTLIWIAVAGAGVWMRSANAGLVRFSGSILQYGGGLMGALCVWQLARVTRLQLQGMRLMRKDPVRFARMAADFERACRAAENDERT